MIYLVSRPTIHHLRYLYPRLLHPLLVTLLTTIPSLSARVGVTTTTPHTPASRHRSTITYIYYSRHRTPVRCCAGCEERGVDDKRVLDLQEALDIDMAAM